MEWRQAPARLEPGRRLYAIGDSHGCASRLRALHERIVRDLTARPCGDAVLVHLGDFIDRGPDSAGCLDAAMGFSACPVVNLMGNHEETANAALDGAGHACTDWLYTGGREALASWGINSLSPRESWAAGIPQRHRDFMARLALWHRVGPYFLVHAGIRPGIALHSQAREDLLCIRRAFLDSEADHGAVIVHGHTPTRDRVPEMLANRINLDTGAVYPSGRLTCAVLEADRVAFWQE
ncbi:metallophosphoesterase [Sabulicella glaciei]|uniref:Metallophosphoesterase n=1 Tax=Sabulicella glaciei TaxID=2984948 RepID=A0ABT3NXS2_9PROT|nr:metallophosphoesterase [Roseococcus sp. MDT2-1-1]MCW8086923.1 metallophosphoesterase [Roseococcus sp. MDT2-1-1]